MSFARSATFTCKSTYTYSLMSNSMTGNYKSERKMHRTFTSVWTSNGFAWNSSEIKKNYPIKTLSIHWQFPLQIFHSIQIFYCCKIYENFRFMLFCWIKQQREKANASEYFMMYISDVKRGISIKSFKRIFYWIVLIHSRVFEDPES